MQDLVSEDEAVRFQDIPPSRWLCVSNDDYTLDDFNSLDEEYEVLEYVLQVLKVPIVPPNIWEAVGDITTSECRCWFILRFIVLYLCLIRHGNLVGALRRQNQKGEERLSVDECPCSEDD